MNRFPTTRDQTIACSLYPYHMNVTSSIIITHVIARHDLQSVLMIGIAGFRETGTLFVIVLIRNKGIERFLVRAGILSHCPGQIIALGWNMRKISPASCYKHDYCILSFVEGCLLVQSKCIVRKDKSDEH
jgi:hypothetical protein